MSSQSGLEMLQYLYALKVEYRGTGIERLGFGRQALYHIDQHQIWDGFILILVRFIGMRIGKNNVVFSVLIAVGT